MARAPHGPSSELPLRPQVVRSPRTPGVSRDHEYYAGLRTRLREAAVGTTKNGIARLTGVNKETVRRYMNSGRPCALFLNEFCRAFEVEPRWLLTGDESLRPDRPAVVGRIGPSTTTALKIELREVGGPMEVGDVRCATTSPEANK